MPTSPLERACATTGGLGIYADPLLVLIVLELVVPGTGNLIPRVKQNE